MNKTIITILIVAIMVGTGLVVSSAPITPTINSESFVYDTELDFNNGTHNGTSVDTDGRLKSIIYDNFTDFTKCEQIISEYNTIPFTYNLGYAEQSTIGANSIGFLVNENGTELGNIKNFSTKSRLHSGSSPKTYIGLGYSDNRPTDTSLMTHTIEVYYTFAFVGFNRWTMRIRYLNDTGVYNYWDGDSWETSGYIILSMPSSAGRIYSTFYESNGTSFNITVHDEFTGLEITKTNNVSLSDVNNTNANYWAICGSEYNVNANNRIYYYNLHQENTIWQSNLIETPENFTIRNLNISLENSSLDASYINSIEVLDENNVTIDWYNNSVVQNTTLNQFDFENNLLGIINSNFSLKFNFKNTNSNEYLEILSLNLTFDEPIFVPVADAGIDQSVMVGDTVQFDGTGSSEDMNYTWTFIYDEETITLYGIEPTYVFEKKGVYTVTLTVTNEAEMETTDTVEITVRNIYQFLVEIILILFIIFIILFLIIWIIRKLEKEIKE